MSILFATHEAYLDHVVGPSHPERPERLGAVVDGVRSRGVGDAVVPIVVRPATIEQLQRVHSRDLIERVEKTSSQSRGRLDADTVTSEGSWNAALLAAGAGLTAIDALMSSSATAAFCAVRPPGHHATKADAMGFCLFSNIAVAAAELADRGERVLVIDFDAHHGNGTQDVFYEDGRVLFVSLHQWPLYPGSGWFDENGSGAGFGSTINVPLPPGTTGDVYLAAFDHIIVPIAEKFGPTWLLVSAGFDAHRSDPLTQMGLSSADFPLMLQRVVGLVPKGRVILMLEGGYDLEALKYSAAATVSALLGADDANVEKPTGGGPEVALRRVDEVRQHLVAHGIV